MNRPPCLPILRHVSFPRVPLPYRLGSNAIYTPLLSQIATQKIQQQRKASTTTGASHGGLAAKLEKPLTLLEKLQSRSRTTGPETTGFIAVEENEGLLFFNSGFP